MTKGERTKQAIVEKAAKVFNCKGYEGTSLADLSEATGIQKGGLYRHFENKEELALAAADFAFRKVREARFSSRRPEQSWREALLEFLQRWIDPPMPLLPGGCPVLNTAIDADDGNPRLLEAVSQELALWVSQLSSLFQEGMQLGQFPEGDPSQAAEFFLASLEGSLMIARLKKDRQVLYNTAAFLRSWLGSPTSP